jgi:hypothetical protein
MQKSKAIRLAGFVGALGASAVLVGAAVQGTGAYFTDSHNGSINASTGHVRVTVTPGNGNLNFTGLLPGDYQSKNVDYVAHGTGAEDIWLVFPSDGSAEAFVGAPDDSYGGGLGRYGHFAVSSTNGASFTSYNLSNERTTDNVAGPNCSVDANGEGGSNAAAADRSDYSVPYCAPRNAILLASGLNNGDSGTATFTFGYTPLMNNPAQQDSGPQTVAYKIVATQHGIRPDNPNN